MDAVRMGQARDRRSDMESEISDSVDLTEIMVSQGFELADFLDFRQDKKD